jgi:hypothetical protein
MKPYLSIENRNSTVRNLISALYNKKAVISDYKEMVDSLKEGIIEPLCELNQSGIKSNYDKYGNFVNLSKVYDESDAERYFDWIIYVVTGTEKASAKTVKEANEQLFQLILKMKGKIQTDETLTLIAPYNWEDKLETFSNRLAELQKSVNKRDERFAETLERIFNWMKEYAPVFEVLKTEYARLNKVQKP